MYPGALLRGFYVTCLFLLCNVSCLSQIEENITSVERFSTATGLADNMVNDVLIDARGVLWVGTENGLNQYLNTEFELFNEASNPAHLVGHKVSRMFLDRRGRVWIGDRFLGITRYDPDQNKWVRYFNQGKQDPEIGGKEIIDFVEMENGDIWIAAFPDILLHYSIKTDSFRHHDLNIEGEYQGILDLQRLNDKELIISTLAEGVLLFNTEQGVFGKYDEFYSSFPFEGLHAKDELHIDAQGNMLVLHDGLMWILKKGTARAIPLDSVSGRDKPVCFFLETGDFLVANYPYILHYDAEYRLLSKQKMLPEYRERPMVCNFRSICRDRQGILWIGSDDGLLKIDPAKQVFKSFSSIHPMPVLYETERDIRFVYTDKKQQVWLAPRSGKKIIRYAPTTGNEGNMIVREFPISHPREQKHTINCLLELWDGRILAAGYSGFFVQKEHTSFEPFPRGVGSQYGLNNTWSMHQTEKDQVLLGTKDLGLFLFYLQGKITAQVTLVDEDGNVIKEQFAIWNMLQIAPGVFWFATSKGLFKAIRRSALRYMLIPHPAFLNYSVWSYCKAENGIIWFGTIENGLIALNAEGQVVKTIGLKEGLPSLTICGIVEDDSSRLWISTASAISRIRFQSDSVEIRSFDILDGLPVEGFNYRAAVNGPQKNLFFTSKRGLVYFQPHHVQTTKKKAQLLIRKCLVSETDYTINNIQDPLIELIPGNNSFSLEPALTDYGNPEKNRFYYQLTGIDVGWKHSSGKHPFIHYSSLPPGHYVLHIRAENPDGQHAINELVIPVHVQPFFWQKGGFKLFVGSLVMALIALMIFLAINRLRLRRHLLKSEISSLRLQMNPHFIFNSLNSIQDFIFHNEKQLAASYLARFARLIRSIMENAGKNSITLSEEVAFLNLYLELESLRFSHFDYSIVIDPDIDAEEYSIPPMLLQPLVENALKHGLSGKQTDLKLVVRFEKRGEGIVCSIADNGVGMEQSLKKDSHQSMGLHVVKERLLVLNRLQGSKYTLSIPKTNTHFPGTGTVIILEL